MGTYFDYFPRIPYNISKTDQVHLDLITDIFFRFKFLDKVKKMKVAYFSHQLQSGETPDILANKVYGEPQAHWIILLLNDIVDPNIDWYKDENTFENFIIDKYGSIAEAYNTIHHYEKTIATRILGFKGGAYFSNTTSQIDYTDIQANTFSSLYTTIPYDTYTLMALDSHEYASNPSGRQFEVSTYRNVINCYDYEYNLNETRRQIKLIYPAAYSSVREEFENLVAAYNPARRLNFKSVQI